MEPDVRVYATHNYISEVDSAMLEFGFDCPHCGKRIVKDSVAINHLSMSYSQIIKCPNAGCGRPIEYIVAVAAHVNAYPLVRGSESEG